jgi:hypothetical protein
MSLVNPYFNHQKVAFFLKAGTEPGSSQSSESFESRPDNSYTFVIKTKGYLERT